jgi:hypothetical protein
MLEFLKILKEEQFDAYFFLPGDKKNEVQVEGAIYKNPGDPIGVSKMGNTYHVILFKENYDTDELYGVDRFDAIFADPLEYMSGLIPENWFGIMARKTTTSNNFIQKTFDKLTKI